jgi:hypothetical protein
VVLGINTCSITSQHHVVFDDRFSAVKSIAIEDDPPEHWKDLRLENTMFVPIELTVDTHDPPEHWEDLRLENTMFVPVELTVDTPVHLQDDNKICNLQNVFGKFYIPLLQS